MGASETPAGRFDYVESDHGVHREGGRQEPAGETRSWRCDRAHFPERPGGGPARSEGDRPPPPIRDGGDRGIARRELPDVPAVFLPARAVRAEDQFQIGYPSDFGFGVDTKFQNAYRIWVVRNTEGIFVISAICTHLGCTPDWKPSENKFKCPCHGSGYDSEGVNFEGPAPRPMDRAHVELDPDGPDRCRPEPKLYKWPKGERSQFNDPGAIIRV